MSLMRMIVKVGIDSTEYQVGLKKLESGVSASMAKIGGLIAGAFTVGAITQFSMRVASVAGEVADLADQLSITTDEVQALQKAADHSGVSFEKYAAALSKVKMLKAEFKSGDPAAVKMFRTTGINPEASDFSILREIGNLPDEQAFEILGSKLLRLKNSLSEIGKITGPESIRKSDIDALDKAGDVMLDLKRVAYAFAAKALSVPATKLGSAGIIAGKLFGSNKPLESAIGDAMTLTTPRDTGSLFGPTPAEAQIQAMNNARRENQFSTLEDLGKANAMRRFSPIDLGDRANVGGFFGPNADINRSMQRNIESISKDMKEVSKVVVGAAQTAP